MNNCKAKIFIYASCALIIFSCKKYQENTLWFKRIKKIKFFDNVKLTEYKVNGIDSLLYLDSFLVGGFKQIGFADNHFKEYYDYHNDQTRGLLYIGKGWVGRFPYSYSRNKKEITLSMVFDTFSIKKNIFVNWRSSWEIIKLEINGERKIKKRVNGNLYEITFKKNN